MLCSFILGFAATALQAPEDPGPYQVAVQDVTHYDSHYSRGNVEARVYYPTNTSDGPFQLAAFMHGWIEPASDYDNLCTHIASHGFVVYSNNTETSLFGTLQPQAADTRAGLQWVEDQSATAGTWLYGLTENQPWIAMGHSMGGSAVAALCKQEPRVEKAIMLEPYKGSLLGNTSGAFTWFSNFTGSALVIAGDEDATNNWSSQVKPWYNTPVQSSRRLWALIDGGDHFGATDPDIHSLWGSGSLSGTRQHLVHRRLVTSFLQAEVLGNENAYYDYMNTPFTSVEGASSSTPLWLVFNPTIPSQLEMGTFTATYSNVRFAAAPATSFTQSNFGDILLDLTVTRVIASSSAPATGIVSNSLPTRASWTGMTLYFQALAVKAGSGSISRLCEVVIP